MNLLRTCAASPAARWKMGVWIRPDKGPVRPRLTCPRDYLQGEPSLTPPDSPQPAKRQRLTSPQASAEPAASPAAGDKAASIECAHLCEFAGMC